ncbi:MAG: hypothetical protein PF542_06125 [Nanoarchaeota archaeon]|jgi:hypothetical protein|nr:hypothetical protein [Nanoarchaeota archaeon]
MDLIGLINEQIEENNYWIDKFEAEHSFKFHKPNYELIPFASSLFEGQKVKGPISRMEDYLLGTMVIDMGTNIHLEINNMKREFSEDKYGWFQRHNKLGINAWGGHAGFGVANIHMFLKRDDLHINGDGKLKTNGEYFKMSFDEKVKYVKSVDSELYRILEKVCSEYK